jgi:Na+/H+ antiporter NhaD/arsenite permease-like protein
VVLAVSEESRLAVAILLILWVSALASAFVDNIPLTTMMIRIVCNLNQKLDLPLQPLVWALAFGACLGGELLMISRNKCQTRITSASRVAFAVLSCPL